MKHTNVVQDKNREIPITFRFFRGTSGREDAEKFNAIKDVLNVENRSEVIRECIDAGYTLYVSPLTLTFADLQIVFPEGTSEEELITVRNALELYAKRFGLPSAAAALILILQEQGEHLYEEREQLEFRHEQIPGLG